MRVMVLVKSNEQIEAGEMPPSDFIAEMLEYNKQLVAAGVMLDADGLAPSSRGTRVVFADGTSDVVDGPFAETKELVSGYWLWEVSSLAEAVTWLQRAPFRDQTVEIRPIFGPEDFGDALTPELSAAEQELRDQIAGR